MYKSEGKEGEGVRRGVERGKRQEWMGQVKGTWGEGREKTILKTDRWGRDG